MTNERAAVSEISQRRKSWRACLLFAVASASSLFISPALGAPGDTDALCLEAYADGQRARKSGALKQAQDALVLCGGESCPRALHGDCLRWLDEVEAAIPTVVFQISSTSGERLVGVQVSIDGGPTSELDGRALAFDPGEHVVSFELAGHRSLEQRLSFTEGEKLVVREVTLEPIAPPPARPLGSVVEDDAPGALDGQNAEPTTLPIWVGAGVGALGLAGFSYFGLTARSQDKELERCYPACPVEQVGRVEQAYRNANVSLGVGAVGVLVAAAWWVFTSPSEEDDAAKQARLEGSWGLTATGLTGRF
jgi:hypothetical protein